MSEPVEPRETKVEAATSLAGVSALFALEMVKVLLVAGPILFVFTLALLGIGTVTASLFGEAVAAIVIGAVLLLSGPPLALLLMNVFFWVGELVPGGGRWGLV